jgi:hypothetical protein
MSHNKLTLRPLMAERPRGLWRPRLYKSHEINDYEALFR